MNRRSLRHMRSVQIVIYVTEKKELVDIEQIVVIQGYTYTQSFKKNVNTHDITTL